MNELKTKFSFNRETVYRVDSNDATVLLAILPRVRLENNQIQILWYDTVKDRIFEIEQILTDSVEEFTFSTTRNKYTLRELSLDYFHEHIVPEMGWPALGLNVTTRSEMTKLIFSTLEE